MPPFFEKNLFCVKNVPPDNKRYPAVSIKLDQPWIIALRLARAGYGGGDPEKILEMKVSTVLNMFHYERFVDDYQVAFTEMNREN